MIKGLIIDWGRTLHDPDSDRLFEGTAAALADIARMPVNMFLVSRAGDMDVAARQCAIASSGVAHLFEKIAVTRGSKHQMLDALVKQTQYHPDELAIVDDRLNQGIAWGLDRGVVTIWKRPPQVTADVVQLADYEIAGLAELPDLLRNLTRRQAA